MRHIVLAIPVTANGCEFCEDFLHSRACVGNPNAMVQSNLMNAILTRDCRECSRYSRSSVGTPDLKNVNTFIYALTYAGDPLIGLTANFENVLKIRYNDARLR